MQASLALGIGTGAIALILAGCSSSTNDTSTNGADATEDVAVGDSQSFPRYRCTGSAVQISIPPDATAIKVTAIGGAGDNDGRPLSGGGVGGEVSAILEVQGSWNGVLWAKVGCQGSLSHTRAGGSGGWPNGGNGPNGSKFYGGGGSTSLETTNKGFSPVIVAGAGGGMGSMGHQRGEASNMTATADPVPVTVAQQKEAKPRPP